MSESPLNPPPALLAKLGTCLVHCSNYMHAGGTSRDLGAATCLWADPEVMAWMAEMAGSGLIPTPRHRETAENRKCA